MTQRKLRMKCIMLQALVAIEILGVQFDNIMALCYLQLNRQVPVCHLALKPHIKKVATEAGLTLGANSLGYLGGTL